ncbi:MAG TPA: hypothetical protein VLG50_05850 [Candidatus Saccharimonadales bacterium]|nr:hypothetical protein [Candidatus Saccharimonadales bacterium]
MSSYELNLFLSLGLYKKIYDSYKNNDFYDTLYQISIDLSNKNYNHKRLKKLENFLLSNDEHIRIYEHDDNQSRSKMIMVKKSKKLVMVKYFELRNVFTDDVV